jgi:hypothetical protein
MCGMAKTDKHVDNLLDALVWMRRKAKRRQPVDDLVDALIKMRRKAKKKVAKRKKTQNASEVEGLETSSRPALHCGQFFGK